MKIDLDKVLSCKGCGVLFIPKEKHFHTCPHCYEQPKNLGEEYCISEADIY